MYNGRVRGVFSVSAASLAVGFSILSEYYISLKMDEAEEQKMS